MTLDAERRLFVEKHGGENAARRYVTLRGDVQFKTGYFIFPDGALLNEHPWGANLEPPADRVERLKLILNYRSVMVEEALEAMQDFRNMLLCHFDRENFKG